MAICEFGYMDTGQGYIDRNLLLEGNFKYESISRNM